jgi:hypothetical protein
MQIGRSRNPDCSKDKQLAIRDVRDAICRGLGKEKEMIKKEIAFLISRKAVPVRGKMVSMAKGLCSTFVPSSATHVVGTDDIAFFRFSEEGVTLVGAVTSGGDWTRWYANPLPKGVIPLVEETAFEVSPGIVKIYDPREGGKFMLIA